MPNTWLNAAEQILTYAGFCLSHPIQAPVCRPFWTGLMVAAFAISVLTILVMVWRFASYRRKLAAALKAQQERDRMPDEETINKVRWMGDKAYSGELSDAEIESRVREGVNKRRLEVAAHDSRLSVEESALRSATP